MIRRRGVLPTSRPYFLRRFPMMIICVACTLHVSLLHAQSPATDTAAFLDPAAHALHAHARAARFNADRSLRSYTATVQSRMAAGLRMAMKDRTLFRSETSARVRWSRDTMAIIQMHAGRVQHPGGVFPSRGMNGLGLDKLYDPAGDRMYFGLSMWDPVDGEGEKDFYIEHPLGDSAERHYRYRTGDTLTVSLEDGRVLRTIELVVIPRGTDPHTVHASMMIEPESGAVVQATFRLTRAVNVLNETELMGGGDNDDVPPLIPGLVTPIEFNITLMTVEYSLWEMKHWLPYSMRFDGIFRIGIATFPASADVSYRIDEVLDGGSAVEPEGTAMQRVAAAWTAEGNNFRRIALRSGKRFIVITPRNRRRLLTSAELPPPIWSNAPGFVSKEQLERVHDRLAKIIGETDSQTAASIDWLARYNRVEALSVGAHAATGTPLGLIDATLRAGIGDLQPNAALSLSRESMQRTLQLRAYHELTATDESRNALGLGNSIAALMIGRDDGEYYRVSGAAFAWMPPPDRRRSWELETYAEVQTDVARNTHISLPRIWSDSVFRTNIRADDATQYGALVRFQPWWGSDPLRRQGGLEVMMQAEDGDYRHARARITLRGAAPVRRGVRIGMEAGAGMSFGDVPVQRLFYLGGATTLRGYETSSIAGTSMARARAELARSWSFANVGVFSDWGWAGHRTDFDPARQRISVGVGASALDGLVRIDLARALRTPRGWRLDLRLDAIL
jgi:hypothetical protein